MPDFQQIYTHRFKVTTPKGFRLKFNSYEVDKSLLKWI